MFNDCFYIEKIARWMKAEKEADTIYEMETNHLRWCYYLEGLKESIGEKKGKQFCKQAKKEIQMKGGLTRCQRK